MAADCAFAATECLPAAARGSMLSGLHGTEEPGYATCMLVALTCCRRRTVLKQCRRRFVTLIRGLMITSLTDCPFKMQ